MNGLWIIPPMKVPTPPIVDNKTPDWAVKPLLKASGTRNIIHAVLGVANKEKVIKYNTRPEYSIKTSHCSTEQMLQLQLLRLDSLSSTVTSSELPSAGKLLLLLLVWSYQHSSNNQVKSNTWIPEWISMVPRQPFAFTILSVKVEEQSCPQHQRYLTFRGLLVIPKGRFSGGSLFQKYYDGHYSKGSLFRK